MTRAAVNMHHHSRETVHDVSTLSRRRHVVSGVRKRQPRTPEPGACLGARFVLGERLAVGPSARVFEAVEAATGARFVAKFVDLDLAPSPDALQAILDYSRHAAQLGDARVVAVEAVGMFEGEPYLISERVEGRWLHEMFSSGMRMAPEDACDLGIELADCLETAHGAGLVHGHLTPSHVALTAGERRCRIIGFDEAGHAAGSPNRRVRMQYQAPELAVGMMADHRTDLYSLAALLYHCLAGVPPFGDAADDTFNTKQMYGTPRSLAGLVPNCPAALESVIMRCLSPHRRDRMRSMEAVACELRALRSASQVPKRVCSGESTVAVVSKPAQQDAHSAPPRRLGAVAVVMVLAAGVALGVAMNSSLSGVAPPASPAAHVAD